MIDIVISGPAAKAVSGGHRSISCDVWMKAGESVPVPVGPELADGLRSRAKETETHNMASITYELPVSPTCVSGRRDD